METTKSSSQIKVGKEHPQEALVKAYVNSLVRDRDPMFFDSQMKQFLLKYSRELFDVEKVVAQADSINYSTSKYEYDQIEQQINNFQGNNVPYFGWNKNFKKAKAYVLDELAGKHLRSLVFNENEDIMLSIPRKDTHAGASYLVTGLRTKGEYGECIYSEVIKAEEEARMKGYFDEPILIGSRTQASQPFDKDGLFTGTFKSKTRLVSMVDIKVIVSESRFARPLQVVLGQVEWYAGGKDDAAITAFMNDSRVSNSHWLSIDYSGFDQSISQWLILEAFDIVKYMYRYDENFDEVLFDAVVRSFCNKSFLDGKGELRFSNKGVPSGSMFTSIIDTLVNRLMILAYLISKGINPRSIRMCIMGDDNIIFSPDELDRDDLEGYLNANFGVTVNAAKSSSGLCKGEDPEFLSRNWSFGGAWRPWKHVVTKLLYPERFRRYGDGKAYPELVLYSYILAYPKTMRDLIVLEDFYHDYPNLSNRLLVEGAQGLSGYADYKLRYLRP